MLERTRTEIDINDFIVYFKGRILHCIPGWSGTRNNPPASTSQVPRLQVWASTHRNSN